MKTSLLLDKYHQRKFITFTCNNIQFSVVYIINIYTIVNIHKRCFTGQSALSFPKEKSMIYRDLAQDLLKIEDLEKIQCVEKPG